MDKTYNIRISFNHGNAITLDLKGCGTLYIKPGKDYYFINAPIEFTNYLAQLRRLGITYKITTDRKGCYQTIDLTAYRVNDARSILSNLRRTNVINEDSYLNEETKKAKGIKPKKDEKKVVLSSDDLIKAKEVKVEEPKVETKVEEPIVNEVPETNADSTVNVSAEVQIEEITDEPKDEVVKEEQKVYTNAELSKMSKTKLLEIAKSYGIEDVSEINTKKEIREAIEKVQK